MFCSNMRLLLATQQDQLQLVQLYYTVQYDSWIQSNQSEIFVFVVVTVITSTSAAAVSGRHNYGYVRSSSPFNTDNTRYTHNGGVQGFNSPWIHIRTFCVCFLLSENPTVLASRTQTPATNSTQYFCYTQWRALYLLYRTKEKRIYEQIINTSTFTLSQYKYSDLLYMPNQCVY